MRSKSLFVSAGTSEGELEEFSMLIWKVIEMFVYAMIVDTDHDNAKEMMVNVSLKALFSLQQYTRK